MRSLHHNLAIAALPILIVLAWWTINVDHPLSSSASCVVVQDRTNSIDNGENSKEHNGDYNDDSLRGIDKLWPVRVLAEYKRQHSNTALQEEVDLENESSRKFALLPYQCPDRAGNFLHNMWKTMTWAIITNRTLLWTYDGTDLQICEQIMTRAKWLPSWDEWSLKLQLQEPVPIPMNEHRWQNETQHKTVIFPQISDILSKDKNIYRDGWIDDPFHKKEYRAYIRAMDQEAPTRAGKLYYHGVDFLFGMLFRETFKLQVGEESLNDSSTKSVVSVALHSRHPVIGDDGSFVNEEEKCLRSLLLKQFHNQPTQGQTSCHVYLMSDRPKTVELLSQWLVDEFNCTPVVANHDSREDDPFTHTEHGPWAGVGYIQDLASASMARTAAVGDGHRSSFMLLVELMEYERRMEAWRKGKEADLKDMEICQLQNKHLSGYDYGPGTPRFVHHLKLLPLVPVKVVNQYKTWNSHQSLEVNSEGRKYAVVDYACPLSKNPEHRLHEFFNRVVWAILTNRTVLVRSQQIEACDEIIQLAEWMPAYEEWSERLNLEDPLYLSLSNSSLTSPIASPPIVYWPDNAEIVESAQIVVFPADPRKVTNLMSVSQHLIASDWSKGAAKDLYSQGPDFLYGLVFFQAFNLGHEVRSAIPEGFPADLESSTNTIALYSQSDENANENNVVAEARCLESVIDRSSPCHVYIMTNRTDGKVPTNLKDWLLERNCTFWTANHREHGSEGDLHTETQLFQDLNFVSKAKVAYIGPSVEHSSSSGLLLEWIEYRRQMETWKQGRFPPLLNPNLTKCDVPA